MSITPLSRAARACAALLRQASAPRLFPLVGTFVSAEFIPPRLVMRRVAFGHCSIEQPGWSDPFWAATIELDGGELVHVDLDPRSRMPRPGEAVSMVGRKARRGGPPAVQALLRPRAALAKR